MDDSFFYRWVSWYLFDRSNGKVGGRGNKGISLFDRFLWGFCCACLWGATGILFSTSQLNWRPLYLCPNWNDYLFLLGDQGMVACPLAVCLSIFAMQLTDTVHPPGGAPAFIAVIGEVPFMTLATGMFFAR